ncbi:hypothetical protein LBX01_08385 [Altererythrobacter sp. N1]|nr:hypothetical protein LBX01_08385 [Altererythrobacter sp. N1]
MSNPQYSIDYGGEAPQQGGMATLPPQATGQPFQIVMPPQKKRISAGAGMFFGIILCGAALYGAEMFAPPDYRPSTITGSYGGRYAAEIKAHDLETQAAFLDWAEEVKVSVAQQQEQYRAAAQGILTNYQAAYDRTRIYAQTTAQLQQDYVHQRTEIARQQQGTDALVINLARLWGRVANVIEPGGGDDALAYADQVGGQLQQELTSAVQNGVTVSVEGWDTGLPPPSQVQADIDRMAPISFPDLPEISRDAQSEGGE